jgi:hypothetical protein
VNSTDGDWAAGGSADLTCAGRCTEGIAANIAGIIKGLAKQMGSNMYSVGGGLKIGGVSFGGSGNAGGVQLGAVPSTTIAITSSTKATITASSTGAVQTLYGQVSS